MIPILFQHYMWYSWNYLAVKRILMRTLYMTKSLLKSSDSPNMKSKMYFLKLNKNLLGTLDMLQQ